MRLRHVAPAGSPIRAVDLLRWSRTLVGVRDPERQLGEAIASRFGFPRVAVTCTGRAGLTLLCEAVAVLAPPDRREVIVPSYTCFSVPASIVKAGLRPHVVDVDPLTFDYDVSRLERVDFSKVAAIVATSLYGYPSDLQTLSRIAADRQVLLIDDAAQAMGARLHGRYLGGWGDAGLLSFDKGKAVAAIDGGAMVLTNPAIADVIARRMPALEGPDGREVAMQGVKLLAYATLLRPSLYWIPNGIPQLGLGETRYTTDFRVGLPGRTLASLALTMLERLPEFVESRRKNAQALLEALADSRHVQLPRAHPGAEPTFLRLPVLVRDRETQQAVIATLRSAGIGATGSYPSSLADVPLLRPSLAGDFAHVAGGRSIAERIVTLPTHPYVTGRDITRMIDTLTRVSTAPRVSVAGVPAR
ncbi:MAG TPA: DegT/DnrJ/EryC1/StrS family aminotransferase [Vicinamibacterales bacterium]